MMKNTQQHSKSIIILFMVTGFLMFNSCSKDDEIAINSTPDVELKAAAITNSAGNHTGDNKITTGGSINISKVGTNDFEFFKVIKNAPKDGKLSPRAERGLPSSKGGATLSGTNLTDGKKVIYLKGLCDIEDGAETTIMQIFNFDPTNSDSSKPFMFLNVESKTTEGWAMRITGVPSGAGFSNKFTLKDKLFSFELRTNNKRARLIIVQDGVTVFNNAWDLSSAGRSGNTHFRFGAYHHGEAVSAASIRFRNTKSSSKTVTANTGI